MFCLGKCINQRIQNFIAMKQRDSAKLVEYFGKSDRFQHYYSVAHNERRHYWGVPNTNFGFYTSDQLEGISKSKRGSTEPRELYSDWRLNSQGNFIVQNNGNGYVHCCTCHNNPKRYLSGQQRCHYCQERQKNNSQPQLTRNSLISGLTNPQTSPEPSSRKIKTVADKQIQVQLKLPSISKHRSKKYQNCKACKNKVAKLQGCLVNNRVEISENQQLQIEKRRIHNFEGNNRYLNSVAASGNYDGRGKDSLIYSFSAKKRQT